jgi:hypothetical protein
LLGALGALGCDVAARATDDAASENGASDEAASGDATSDAPDAAASNGEGGTAAGLGECENPEPLMPGVETGLFRCEGDFLHRAEAHQCPSELPRDSSVGAPTPGAMDQCSRDSDCSDPLEYCELIQTNPIAICSRDAPEAPTYGRYCRRGCREDSDCSNEAVCVCSSPIGYCSPLSYVAGCHSDADCAGGAQCLSNARRDSFAGGEFACELSEDTCSRDEDCTGDTPLYCLMQPGGRECARGSICGRPFLVDAAARLAPARCTSAWLGTGSGPAEAPRAVGVELGRELARHWTEIGRMEHASIAAFARFTLQLLGIGAPLELLQASQRAQADETRHACLAFELASHYAGSPIGAGPLSLSGTLLETSWEDILRTTIAEGCVGETSAAVEAALAAELCTDPVLAGVLSAIAEDEARHAALAWRTVRWMLRERPSLRGAAERGFAEAAARVGRQRETELDREPNEVEQLGALTPARRAAASIRCLRDVVLPCARELFGTASQRRGEASASLLGAHPSG